MLDQSSGYDFTTITAVRRRLAKCGYVPLPCEGKRPVQKGWQKRQAPSADEIELWAKSFHLAANTGILTKDTPVIDIDIDDRDVADALEHMLADMFGGRGAFLTRIGNPPRRAIPFQTDAPFAKLTLNLVAPNGDTRQKIEMLADGQQCIVAGIHPDTHKPYHWTHDALWTVQRSELPVLRAEDVTEFFARAVAEVLTPAGWTVAGERKPNGNTTDGPQSRADWVTLTSNILAGTDLHDSIVRLAASMVAEGGSDQFVIRQLQTLMQASSAPRDDRWRERYDEIARAVRSARAKFGPEATVRPPLTWLDMSGWDTIPVPERQWLVRERIPLRQPTILSGEGAVGKSLVVLHLVAATALGRDWLGRLPEQGPAWYIGAEDDARELHIRLSAIQKRYGITYAELVAANFRMLSLFSEDAVLAAPNKRGIIEPTELYQQILEQAREEKPKCIALDVSADMFAGDEISRVQVRQFVGLLRRLAGACDGAVILLSHPSLAGISSGSGLSGSTAWHNSVRARMYLTSPKPEPDEQPDTDLRELTFKKNNYGPVSEGIVLRYRDGLFLPVAGTSGLEKLATEQEAEHLFLDLLDAFTKQGRNVSDKKTAHNYAPTAFTADPRAKQLPAARKALAEAMARLFASSKIRMEPYGRPSRGFARLVRGAA